MHCSFSESLRGDETQLSMQNATYVPGGSTMCVNRAYGTIMGQNVTVISSGINAQASAICTQEVLQCAGLIKEMIFSGTAGFSPAVRAVSPTIWHKISSAQNCSQPLILTSEEHQQSSVSAFELCSVLQAVKCLAWDLMTWQFITWCNETG